MGGGVFTALLNLLGMGGGPAAATTGGLVCGTVTSAPRVAGTVACAARVAGSVTSAPRAAGSVSVREC